MPRPEPRLLQIGKYFSPDKGGIETVTEGISTALDAQGIRADVLCFARRREYPTMNRSYSIMRAPSNVEIGNKAVSIDYVRQIAAFSSDYDIGLLHLPNPLGMVGTLRGWRKPLILLWHADILPYPMLSPLIRRIERASIAQSAAIISPTAMHSKGSYLATLISPKREIIPYPFFPDRLPAPNRAAPEVQRVEEFLGGRRLVLAVGRLVPYKGFDVLIRAAGAFEPSLATVIVGTGPLMARLNEQVICEGAAHRVQLAGHLSDGALSALYERAAIVTMPSVTRAEMYGMTQVEAMSYGVPVVSTLIPRSGVPYVNLDEVTGLIVPPSDPAALASAINRIGCDPLLRQRLSLGARRVCEEDHNSRRAGVRYADLIRRVLADVPQG